MEKFLEEAPDFKLLVSFFSPSGYEIRKDYAKAAHVTYLPLDSPTNAQKFLDIVRPQLVFFVKYDLWIHFLRECFSRKIPTLLISAQLHPDSSFLKGPFQRLYKSIFAHFTAIFTQNQETVKLLKAFAPTAEVILSSDTRYDRVLQTQENFQSLPEIEAFVDGRYCLIGGSTWPKGEEMLFEIFQELADKHPICMILAPHEIHSDRIEKWIHLYPEWSLRYSEIDKREKRHRILWIDNIGMLSRLYAYAQLAYIGGAWDKGLHNTLEAVVFGVPVFFGPSYKKYPEAYELIENRIGFSVASTQEALHLVEEITTSSELALNIQRKCREYIQNKAGATGQIISWCREKKLF